MKHWFSLLVLVLMMPLVHAGFEEGIKYQRIANPQPTSTADKIEVLELFWYACPHCYQLEAEVEVWLESKPDDVEFVRMPAVLGPSWELLARAYYTADLLEATDKIHNPLFERLHKERKRIRNADELKAFFVEQGVSAEDFDNTFSSFAVITKTNRAKQVRNMYGISGVPAIVVNGKYLVTAKLAGSNKQMLEVVDYLVAQERDASSTEAAAAAP
ncbi:MAG: thiol:disulfide interchange protein DsbA/DsbL [Pseudomonadota bacterium]|nr:thiol:disulfide interchange protein DsbA/DsbL [Pseudomonadota bacterium]